MAAYTLDMVSRHQRNILFILLLIILKVPLNIYFMIKHFDACPKLLHISSHDCASISTFLRSITKLENIWDCYGIIFMIPNVRLL